MNNSKNPVITAAPSLIWDNLVAVPGTPAGFTVRTAYPNNPNGVEVMLEKWEAGTEEPPHSHPGDDMTIVVEGKMSVQFYKKEAGALVPDGNRLFLNNGEVGYIKGGRIHAAHYIEDCRLVYVHDKKFEFIPQS